MPMPVGSRMPATVIFLAIKIFFVAHLALGFSQEYMGVGAEDDLVSRQRAVQVLLEPGADGEI